MIIAKFESDGSQFAILRNGDEVCLLKKVDGAYTQVSSWEPVKKTLFVRETF